MFLKSARMEQKDIELFERKSSTKFVDLFFIQSTLYFFLARKMRNISGWDRSILIRCRPSEEAVPYSRTPIGECIQRTNENTTPRTSKISFNIFPQTNLPPRIYRSYLGAGQNESRSFYIILICMGCWEGG